MIKVRETISTDGQGLWSDVATEVEVVGLDLGYVSEEEDYGELRVYFDTDSWNINKQGLIYTDKTFQTGVRAMLQELGFDADGDTVSYSEQGMQGDNYVSFDVDGSDFIASFRQIELVNRI
jgi:hypothetical protein